MLKQLFSEELRQRQPLACHLLSQAIVKQHLANAYLLTGNADSDKWEIVKQIACFHNCLNKSEKQIACPIAKKDKIDEYCQNCQWLMANEHPLALLVLEGEGKSQIITVDKVRKLTAELIKSSPHFRVCLIANAQSDVFAQAAANALLKAMEEPPENCLFVLLAESGDMVLPTVFSRCQSLPVNKGYSELLEVKSESEEAPVQNLKLNRDLSYLKIAGRSLSWLESLKDKYNEADKDGENDGQQFFTNAIDQYVGREYKRLLDQAIGDPLVTQYLSELLLAGDKAKRQIDSFVKPQAVLETFSFKAYELSSKYWGE